MLDNYIIKVILAVLWVLPIFIGWWLLVLGIILINEEIGLYLKKTNG